MRVGGSGSGGAVRRAARALLACALAAGAVATALAGCGSSPEGTNADPASAVPASAPLYVGLTLTPKGGPQDDAQADARKLTHLAEPYPRLAEALLASAGTKPAYKREIAPWLGEHAGVFLDSLGASRPTAGASATTTLFAGGSLSAGLAALGVARFGAHGAQGALVADTKDLARARSFVANWGRQRAARPARYRGIGLRVAGDGAAAAIVKRFVVMGSETGVKDVVDVSLGGARLSASGNYAKPPTGAIATVQLAPRQLPAGATTAPIARLLGNAESVSLTLTPHPDSLVLDGQIRGASAASPLTGGAGALAALPGGSWLAAGIGNVGTNAAPALGLLRAVSGLGLGSAFSSIGGAGIEALLARLGSPSLGLSSIFGHWAGPAAVSVSGTGLFDLQAALTIASSDPAASRAAVGRLASALRRAGAAVSSATIPGTDAAASVRLTGFPAVLFIADGQKKLIVGLGRASVEGALQPSGMLSASPSYSAATQVLGGFEPSLIVEFPALLGFLEGIGLTQSPPLSSAVPYLKSLGTLAAGTRTNGETTHLRAVLGLS